jgi:hypothetical protein
MDSRENKKDDSKQKIAVDSDINKLFRSRMSDIAYAWQVVKLLGNAEGKILQQGDVTLEQVENIADYLSKILNDSSRVNECIVLIKAYLTSGNMEKFLLDAKTLAVIVQVEAKAINFEEPKAKALSLFQEGFAQIQLPTDKIMIERERENITNHGVELVKIESSVSIKSLVLGIWKQETSRISHDFRIIGSQAPGAVMDLACIDCKERLKQLCRFLNEVLALRSVYETNKINMFGYGTVSSKKKNILGQIEKKLAETVDQQGILSARAIYNAIRPTLVSGSNEISKDGRLKKMIESVIEKYDAELNPVAKKNKNSGMGLNR